jgi:hypothetical protein
LDVKRNQTRYTTVGVREQLGGLFSLFLNEEAVMSSRIRSTKLIIIGRCLSALAALPFCVAATMKFKGAQEVVQGLGHFGWPPEMIVKLAVLESASVVLYLIPRVAVLGAIVLTGFLGGAIATHMRVGESVYLHVLLGLLIWGGLYLREPRLRALLPWRKY